MKTAHHLVRDNYDEPRYTLCEAGPPHADFAYETFVPFRVEEYVPQHLLPAEVLRPIDLYNDLPEIPELAPLIMIEWRALTKTEILSVAAGQSTITTYDPKADELFSEATILYKHANKAYRRIAERQFPYITIKSGRRSAIDQANLYVAYIGSIYGDPPANPANRPGTSKHEYGLAIDVVRGDDEANLRDSLLTTGWSLIREDEGWHFEARGVASWNRIISDVDAKVRPLSDHLAENVVQYYEYRKKVQDNEPKYRREQGRLTGERAALTAARNELSGRQRQLNDRAAQLSAEQRSIEQERRNVSDLQSRINGMHYSYCPNGQSYDQCTLKQKYDRERQLLIDEYNRRAAALRNREKRLRQDQSKLQSDQGQYQRDLANFNARLRKFQDDLSRNDDLGRQVTRWTQAMNDRLAERPALIAVVAEAVGSIS